MTNRIAEITARCEAATPGPWTAFADSNDVRVCRTEDGSCLCCLALMGEYEEDGNPMPETEAKWSADAALIAHAREDIPFLLAEIERLREAQRWIPVVEGLPKTNKPVQVYMPKLYMSIQTGFYDRYYGEDDGEWYEHWVAPGEVTHWKELPAAPVVRGEWVEAKSGVMSVWPPGQVMCSVCGQRMPSQWKKMPPYCYGCGAKMEDKP